MKFLAFVFGMLLGSSKYDFINTETITMQENFLDLCDSTENAVTEVYFGWPHKISCDLFLYDADTTLYDLYYDADYSLNADSKIQCIIRDGEGRTLFNTSVVFDDILFNSPGLYLPDVNEQIAKQYELILQVSSTTLCLRKQVHLDALQYHEQSCEEFLRNQNSFIISSKIGQPKRFVCSNLDLRPVIYATTANSNATYQWQRNCSNQLPEGANVNSENNNLEFSPVSYEHAGSYVCSITHNGMTRYVTSYNVCVQKPDTLSSPVITCSRNVYTAVIGKNATINCEVNFGEGHIKRSHFVLFAGKRRVLYRCTLNQQSSTDNRISCQYTLNEERCFLHVPSPEERKKSDYIVPLQLTIRNLRKQDFRTYIVQADTINGDRTEVEVHLKQEMLSE